MQVFSILQDGRSSPAEMKNEPNHNDLAEVLNMDNVDKIELQRLENKKKS